MDDPDEGGCAFHSNLSCISLEDSDALVAQAPIEEPEFPVADESFVLRRLQARLLELESENEELRWLCDTNDDLLNTMQSTLDETNAGIEEAEARVRELELQLEEAQSEALIDWRECLHPLPVKVETSSPPRTPQRLVLVERPAGGPSPKGAKSPGAADSAGRSAVQGLVLGMVAVLQLGSVLHSGLLILGPGSASSAVGDTAPQLADLAVVPWVLWAASGFVGLCYACTTGCKAAVQSACVQPMLYHAAASVWVWLVPTGPCGLDLNTGSPYTAAGVHLAVCVLLVLLCSMAGDWGAKAKAL